MNQLGRRLTLHPTTISLTTDQLQERGLVTRKPHPTDRRTTLASLTPDGVRTLTTVNQSVGGSHYGLDGVSDRLAITLTEVIRQVRGALGDT
jgi:DNA-binding MarR family transcriptional regulator